VAFTGTKQISENKSKPDHEPRDTRRKTGPLLVLGIMSGTSIDGVDYALCSVSETQVQLLQHWQRDFPARLQNRLRQAARGLSSCHETAQLHHDLGRFYAEEAARGLKRTKLDLIALHGQTVFHNPAKPPATFQLGEPAYLVETLQVPVVSNFRAADLAAGGQGAPLATLFHRIVFGQRGSHVCVNNLGGISNVTSIDGLTRNPPRLAAFDTGPANMLMDLAIQQFTRGRKRCDENGDWARRGVASEKLLARWLKHPYFLQRPPKSTGRELFGEVFLAGALKQMHKLGLSRFDQLATLAEFTARSVVLNYRLHLKSAPQRVVLTGGGAANPDLVERLRRRLALLSPKLQLQTCDQLGWPVQSIEPAAFALLAFYRFLRKPGNLPDTTGANRPVLCGQISEP
jgi:anhydro-N-acetylmuramic acid kinase